MRNGARVLVCAATLGALVSAAVATPAAAVPVKADTSHRATLAAVPRYDHVVIAIMENRGYSQIIGSSEAPYITGLSQQGANFTAAYAETHPSQPNYLALFSGDTQGITDDSCPHTFTTPNLGRSLLDANLTFAGYSENMPSDGYTGCTSGTYARKHNPWANWSTLPSSTNLRYSRFPTDYTQLPTVSFVIPDLCNDMHDCSIGTGDTWLKSHLDAYAQWAKAHNSLFILTFDEDNNFQGNRIPTIFYGAGVKAGDYSGRANHYNILRTVEDMYGLPAIGASASATPITGVFTSGTPGAVTVTNPGSQTSTVGTAVNLRISAADSAGLPLTYAATGLPAGLAINATTGIISGTPTTATSASVTVSATDSAGATGSAAFSWTVTGSGGGTPANYEAEASANTLAGGARTSFCWGCSGLYRVAGLGNGGTVTFNRVTATAAGARQMTIAYTNADASRTATISVNGGAPVSVSFPGTGGSGTVRTVTVTVTLAAGSNTIAFANPSAAAPDIDRITV